MVVRTTLIENIAFKGKTSIVGNHNKFNNNAFNICEASMVAVLIISDSWFEIRKIKYIIIIYG